MAYSLSIGGQIVFPPAGGPAPQDLSPAQRVSLVSFKRDYDGAAELGIRFDGDWRTQHFPADTRVQLTRDGVIVFDGLLDLPRPLASDSQAPAVEYTAFDHARALRAAPAIASNGGLKIELAAGSLSSVVSAFLAHVGGELTRVGMSASVLYSGGAETAQCFPLAFESETIDAAFRRIASQAPGVRCFVDPNNGNPAYRFVRIFSAAMYGLQIDVERIPELGIQQSIEDRCGAVATLETLTTAEGEGVLIRTLTPAWDQTLEAQWKWAHAFSAQDPQDAPDGPAELEDALSKVFRLFSYDSFATELQPGAEMLALVEGTVFGVQRFTHIEIASVDPANKTVLLKLPAIKGLRDTKAARRNANVPGRSKPTATKLRFTVRVVIPIFQPSYRVPATGFGGTAYGFAPITCGWEKRIGVPGGIDPQQYAQDAFNVYSEPITTGSVPIDGDLPGDVWLLNRRINLASVSHGPTGLESLAAPLMGVSHRFEGGGQAQLEFSTDRSSVLRGGAS